MEKLIMDEEKLSEQQLLNSTLIKMLLAKEKENEATIAAQKKKLDEQTKELERLTTVLDSKQEMENVQSEAMQQLRAVVQRQEKVHIKHKSDLKHAQKKLKNVRADLNILFKEERDQSRANASKDSKAQKAALSAAVRSRKELEATMEREQQRFRHERKALIKQVDDSKLQMTIIDKNRSRCEDRLSEEISYLEKRLQQVRSPDLTDTVTSATLPFLRQIENLQAILEAQSAVWERVEKNLTDRLAQIALAMAQGKEKTADDHLMKLLGGVVLLDAANKQEKDQLAAEVESDRSKLEELQDIRSSAVAQLESSKQRLNEELKQLKMEKDLKMPAHASQFFKDSQIEEVPMTSDVKVLVD
ncbi:hypothetical protein BsWGS_06434 [Bradybaena similaris]